jgi:hypothetical protein
VPKATARITAKRDRPRAHDKLFAEFKAYWQIANELLGKATKEQLAPVVRILAPQSARDARTYGGYGDQPKELVLSRTGPRPSPPYWLR